MRLVRPQDSLYNKSRIEEREKKEEQKGQGEEKRKTLGIRCPLAGDFH